LIRFALDGDDVDDGATATEEIYLGAGVEPEPSAALEGTGDRITVGVYDSGCPIETLSPGLARIFPFISTPGELLLTSPISEANTHKLKPYRLTSLILVEYRKVLYTTLTSVSSTFSRITPTSLASPRTSVFESS